MSRYTNEYNYSKEVISQYQTAWLNNLYFYSDRLTAPAICLLIVVFAIWRQNYFFLLFLILPLAYFLHRLLWRKKMLQTEKERVEKTYQDEQGLCRIRYELDTSSGRIIGYTNGEKTADLALADIYKIVETKDIYILALTEKSCVLLKNSFTEGSSESFHAYLKSLELPMRRL